jgi:hypothetical protein
MTQHEACPALPDLTTSDPSHLAFTPDHCAGASYYVVSLTAHCLPFVRSPREPLPWPFRREATRAT